MNRRILYALSSVVVILLIFASCSEEEYELGALTAPSNVTLTAEIVGQDAEHPYGDGSGEVIFTVDADNALAYKIDYGTSTTLDPQAVRGQVTKKYVTTGINDYRVTLIAYGEGGAATNVTQAITVRSDFDPDPAIVTALTADGSKTWVVEKAVPGHFGVGPWAAGSVSPEWWSAPPNDKEACCNCFYTSSFVFSKTANGYSLQSVTPDGAFTKTGALAGGLPGIPASGEEGCYPYAGGTSEFTFSPATSGVADSNSTQTSILLGGNETFIGYGAVQKEYEILEITPDNLYLRVQGTETGNAWYLRLVPAAAE